MSEVEKKELERKFTQTQQISDAIAETDRQVAELEARIRDKQLIRNELARLSPDLASVLQSCFVGMELSALHEWMPEWKAPVEEKKAPPPTKCAWVTLVMKGDEYVQGALPLAYSLRTVKTAFPLVCMVTPDVSLLARQRLALVYDRIVEVPYCEARCPPMHTPVQEQVYRRWIDQSFTKWRCLELIEYEKVVFLDADMIVLDNIDHLFRLPAPAGTFSNAFGWPYGKETHRRPRGTNDPPQGIYNPYYGLVHGAIVPKSAIDQGLNHKSFAVCGTTLLLAPSKAKWQEMEEILRPHDGHPFGFRSCYSGYDEQVITWLYQHDPACEWTMISQVYNYIPWQYKWLQDCGTGRTRYGRPAVFHYIMKKPWLTDRGTWPDNEVYWQLVLHMIQSQPSAKAQSLLRGAYSLSRLHAPSPTPIVGCAYCDIWNLAHKQQPHEIVSSSTHTLLDKECHIQCPLYLDRRR